MKKLAFYFFLMIIIIVALPLLIVKGCSSGPPIEEEGTPPIKIQDGVKIKVFIKEQNKVKEMLLEEYVKGVVAAEMPAEFGLEALKAQAVAARTYAFARIKKLYLPESNLHSDADVCTDSTHCQAWTSKENAVKRWAFLSRSSYWNKIEEAVKQTEGIIITYNNKIINPVFHSNSGGKTENSEDVWDGKAEPYLRSVTSEGEEGNMDYKNVVLINADDFCNKLINEYSDIKLTSSNILDQIKILEYSAGGRIMNIKVGNLILKGTDIRRIFNLKSTNIKFEMKDKDTLLLTTYGNGHGVGMSQWGANYLAKNGGSCEEIIKHYYKGVELSNISNFLN